MSKKNMKTKIMLRMRVDQENKYEMTAKFSDATPTELIQTIVYALDIALESNEPLAREIAELIPGAVEKYYEIKNKGGLDEQKGTDTQGEESAGNTSE